MLHLAYKSTRIIMLVIGAGMGINLNGKIFIIGHGLTKMTSPNCLVHLLVLEWRFKMWMTFCLKGVKVNLQSLLRSIHLSLVGRTLVVNEVLMYSIWYFIAMCVDSWMTKPC